MLIIITPLDGDIFTSYDIGPHTGSPLGAVHDNPLIEVSNMSLTVKSTGEGVSGPMYVQHMHEKWHNSEIVNNLPNMHYIKQLTR